MELASSSPFNTWKELKCWPLCLQIEQNKSCLSEGKNMLFLLLDSERHIESYWVWTQLDIKEYVDLHNLTYQWLDDSLYGFIYVFYLFVGSDTAMSPLALMPRQLLIKNGYQDTVNEINVTQRTLTPLSITTLFSIEG